MAEATKTSTTYCGETITTQQIRENVLNILGVDASRLLRQLTEANPTIARTKARLLLDQLRELGLIDDKDNKNDTTTSNYTTSGCSTTNSSSTTSSLYDYVTSAYKSYIGKAPAQAIKEDIRDLIASGFNERDQWEYVLMETSQAPYPSWRYARAIIKRVQEQGALW